MFFLSFVVAGERCPEKVSFVVDEMPCPEMESLLHIVDAGEDGWSWKPAGD